MARDFNIFVKAQDPVYDRVLNELTRGCKASHWMWYIFPQISGLGHSAMAKRYAIGSGDEAKTYLAHPVLGARLNECTALVLNVPNRTAEQIFGHIDSLKFCSSMTLFALAATENPVFQQALDKYYEGADDPKTVALL